ncbi:MAG: hypothetical protein IIU63_01050 [Clostridia bacterium]|nr:hypothetical protein [Clostridia bacterium]
MYYLPTDYLVLTAIRDKKTAPHALLEAACASLPYPLSKNALAFSLGKLCAGGYIEGYALTEKGAAFFKNNKKFLESKRNAKLRLCALLCAEQIKGEVTPYELSDAAYTEACDALRRKYAIPSPDFTIEAEGGDLYLCFGGAYTEQEDEEAIAFEDKIKVTTTSLCDLADTFLAYFEDGRHHKCCLYADGAPAYVATVSRNEGYTRLNIAKILYNRQRFIGKRDGNLDYAQCGDFAFDCTANDIEIKFVYALMQAEHQFGGDFPYEAVTALMVI